MDVLHCSPFKHESANNVANKVAPWAPRDVHPRPLGVPDPLHLLQAGRGGEQGRAGGGGGIILMGKAFYMDEKFTRKQVREIRSDLGWTPLWTTTVVHSIMLYQRMRWEPAHLPHAMWAN